MKFKDTKFKDLTNLKYYNNINVNYDNLTSLEGSPKIVFGSFNCNNNNLTSLKYCPKEIDGNFNCGHNKLTSLEGSPLILKKSFYCNNNNLISLKGSPKIIGGSFNCENNNLSTLKYCPKEITYELYCSGNPSLKNIKQQIIENQIKTKYYSTDEGEFVFEEIRIEFEEYGRKILEEKKSQELRKQRIKLTSETKKNLKEDFGLSI